MATWYVNGNAAVNGNGSESSPWKTLTAAINGSGVGDTIYVLGSFSNNITLTGKANQTWIGVNKPTITKTNDVVVTPASGTSFHGIIFSGGSNTTYDVFYLNAAVTGWAFYDCTFIGGKRSIVSAQCSGNFFRCKMYGYSSSNQMGMYCAASTLVFDRCVFGGGRYPYTPSTSGFRIYSGDVRFYNNMFLGMQYNCIDYNRDAMTRIDIINNIFAGHGANAGADSYGIIGRNAAGAIVENISNNYGLGSGKDPTKKTSGPTVTFKTGKLNAKISNQCFFSLAIDDYLVSRRSYYQDMAAAALANKVPIVQYVSYIATNTDDDWAFLNSIGNEFYKFGNHTSCHNFLTSATFPYLFRFTVYPVNSTVNFDGTTLTITSDGSTVVYSQDVSEMKASTLQAAINALGGFTVTAHANSEPTLLPCKIMANVSNATIASLASNAMALDFSTNSRWYDYMVNYGQTVLESKINPAFLSHSFAYPGGYVDSTLSTWMTAHSTYQIASVGNNRAGTCDPRIGVDMLNVFRIGWSDLFNADPSIELSNIRSFMYMIAACGGVAGFYGHSVAEFPASKIASIVSVAGECGISLCFPDDITAYIHNNMTLSGGIYYTSNMFPPDGRMLSSSVCIDDGIFVSGINDNGSADIWGKKIYGMPNIGPDQGVDIPYKTYGVISPVIGGSIS